MFTFVPFREFGGSYGYQGNLISCHQKLRKVKEKKMVYDDRHRTFLQVIMQEGAVHDDDATALCFKIFGKQLY